MLIKNSLIFFLLSFSLCSLGVLLPPNYNFNIDQLKPFMPYQKFAPLKKQFPEAKIVFKNESFATYKILMKHQSYHFPIFVQVKQTEITDFFIKLPSYFLHDVFHQSLINRFGKQDQYNKIEETAVYTWKNKDNIQHIYSGTCTITCFPLYYSAVGLRYKSESLIPLIEKMNNKLGPN